MMIKEQSQSAAIKKNKQEYGVSNNIINIRRLKNDYKTSF